MGESVEEIKWERGRNEKHRGLDANPNSYRLRLKKRGRL